VYPLEVGEDRSKQGRQSSIDEDHLVIGVTSDVDQLLRRQTRVEGVQHGAHRRDSAVSLDVLLVVPHQGCHTLVATDPDGEQRMRQLG
jgi:hypothetical protein